VHFAVVVVEYDIAVVIRVVCTCCVDAVSGVVCVDEVMVSRMLFILLIVSLMLLLLLLLPLLICVDVRYADDAVVVYACCFVGYIAIVCVADLLYCLHGCCCCGCWVGCCHCQ